MQIMNTKLLLYGALGFLLVRYALKQRQTANGKGETLTTVDLLPENFNVSRRPNEPSNGFQVSRSTYPYQNNANNCGLDCDRRKQL